MNELLFGRFHKSIIEKRGTIKGLHFQIAPYEEIKIVRCVKGAIFDVWVDLLSRHWTWELLKGLDNMTIIPKGYAHGYQTLEDNCEVEYFITNEYSPENSSGLLWNDPKIAIDWPIREAIVSERDSGWARL